MARSTKNCERRELEKVETDATLMDKNPDKYPAHLFLSSTHCAFDSELTYPGSNPTVASRFLPKSMFRGCQNM